MHRMFVPEELKKRHPLSIQEHHWVKGTRKTCEAIIERRDERLAIICGPCSIHNIESAILYASKLKELSEAIDDRFYVVMRAYIEKPRTALGWKGFLYDPDLNSENDLLKGLDLSRQLLCDIVKLGLPIAVEVLDPNLLPYFDDLITWGFIGSRTSSSQIHRQIASYAPFPIGFKNSTDGSLEPALNGMRFASEPQSFFGIGQDGRISPFHSLGNCYTHLVLRGSEKGPNCDASTIQSAQKSLLEQGLHPSLLIDCSHGNSQKNYRKQPENFERVIELASEHPSAIMGMMLESHLKADSQTLTLPIDPEKSITDACIDWATTERLLTRHLTA